MDIFFLLHPTEYILTPYLVCVCYNSKWEKNKQTSYTTIYMCKGIIFSLGNQFQNEFNLSR